MEEGGGGREEGGRREGGREGDRSYCSSASVSILAISPML